MNEPITRDPETLQKTIQAETEVTLTRFIGTCVTLVLIVLLGGITYCGSRPDNDALLHNQLQMTCMERGGSWMRLDNPNEPGAIVYGCQLPKQVPAR